MTGLGRILDQLQVNRFHGRRSAEDTPIVVVQRERDPALDRLPSDQAVPVPVPVRIAAAWGWRILAIAAAVLAVGYGLSLLSELVIPILVALLLSALFARAATFLARWVPRGLAAGIVLILGLAVIAGAVTLVVQQIGSNASEMGSQVTQGVQQVRAWLAYGPFKVTDTQLDDAIASVREYVTNNEKFRTGLLHGAVTVGHVGAGVVLTLFSTFFFLYQGDTIWAWFVRLFPRLARERIDSSGRVGWVSLTAYVRATVLVAFTDAVGITVVALVLRVPFAGAIGVLVFISAFVPIVGALASGIVAVLIALVAHGLVSAIIMAAGVLVVQQLESHVLQPFLMGRLVRLHPLAIIFSIAGGAVLFGIVGALFAVPLAAFTNSVVNHLASGSDADSRAPENPPEAVHPAEQVPRSTAGPVADTPPPTDLERPETD
jgi:predicted PurR-regulated permease PerM